MHFFLPVLELLHVVDLENVAATELNVVVRYQGAVLKEVDGESRRRPRAGGSYGLGRLGLGPTRRLGLVDQGGHGMTDGWGQPELCGVGTSHVNLEAAVLTQEDDGRSSLRGAGGAVADGHHVNDLGLGSNFYLLLE